MRMQEKTAYIISLKFAPGLKKEFMVLGEHMRKKGLNLKYLISQSYSNIEGNVEGLIHLQVRDGIIGLILDYFDLSLLKKIFNIFNYNKPSFVLFYNPHPLNPRIAKLIKKRFPYAILSLYLHDPYKPDKSSYGLAKGIYISLAEFIQALTVKYMDYVISPSEYSSQLFHQRYPKFKGQNFIAPLLVPDKRTKENKERKFFSIVGAAHPATGHDTFIELVNYVSNKDLNYEFALISSSNIKKFTKALNEKAKERVKIINKKIIKDSEIDEVIRESYAVFRLDREVTQSGVVPVAYMNETPVIARDIPGLSQHIWHKETGYIVSFNTSSDELIKAMDYVKSNFPELSKNVRQKYEEIWAEWNFDKYYGWLLIY